MVLKLIATDMDGTLLTDTDKSFDRELFDALLTEMDELGVKFVVASGNQYQKLRIYMDGFHGRGISYLAENGAHIADDGGDLLVTGFSPQLVAEIVAALEELPEVGYIMSAAEAPYLLADKTDVISELIRDHLSHLGMEVPTSAGYIELLERFYPGVKLIDSPDAIVGQIVKFALLTPRGELETVLAKLKEKLPAKVVPVASGFGAIDLLVRGVNKGSALAWFCEGEGIDAADVIAYGDNSNDIEMLAWAGEGIAMENSVPALLEVADTVIGTNHDGAVLKDIARRLTELKGR